ncbi:MAG TPA: thioesterase family protein [Gemmatimonadaceae bacterium]|nr:thioesterase family protein [Gemmatimonadaceae bacterium]
MPHELTIHVYPTDCDMLGHVNHATMITFLEHARWALVEPHASMRELAASGVWPVVRHVDIGYSAQAIPGDDLLIRSGLLMVGTTSFVVRQDVMRQGDRTLLASAKLAFVCIGRDGQKVPVPESWRAVFPHWVEPAGGGGGGGAPA